MAAQKKSPRVQRVAYFNRELSWLAYNRRILDQACDEQYPLLERMRFLSFVSSTLDEFFEIRVAGLMQQIDSNVTEAGLDGLGPKEQLRRIHNITASLVADKYRCWHEKLVPELMREGVVFKTRDDLKRRERQWLSEYFNDQVYPVLTPLAIDPAHPFPQFGNKTLNILLWLDDPSTPQDETMLAFIPVPRILPRVVEITGSRRMPSAFVFLSDVLKMFGNRLFPGYRIKSIQAFRITRNSDLYIDEEEAENLLQTIEEELHKMRRGAAVRLEIEDGVNDELLSRLLVEISLNKNLVFPINGPINLMRLMPVYHLIDRPDLKFKPFIPYTPPALSDPGTLFESISQEDFLLHHPYDAFGPVVDLVKDAAQDPHVLAIKLTLYRTNAESPIVAALEEAARNDKQVTALIELKARFDEARNIQWAKQLEDAGVHVVYGFVGLKTHCKCLLIVRREGRRLCRYAHLGTGNYHVDTARLYTDLSYLTSRPEITAEVAELFNTLTGFARKPGFRHLLVAPYNLHTGIQKRIIRETRNARAGHPARIIAKCNSLIDRETIDNLYAASRAGVRIDLIIRGICGLVPNVKGLSENIRVRSILGRFLEHSRVFYFENHTGSHPDVLVGSADWMPRNFYRRVEVVFPVRDEALRTRLIEEILQSYCSDTASATALRANGSYVRVSPAKNESGFNAQEYFMEQAARQRTRGAPPSATEGVSLSDPRI